jgi:hypothetical protein
MPETEAHVGLVERYRAFKELTGSAPVGAFAAKVNMRSTRELPLGSSFAASDRTTVPKTFNIHDRVSWNSEAGRVSCIITPVHTRELKVKGYTLMRAQTIRNTRSRAARRTTSPFTRVPRSPSWTIDVSIVRRAR